MDQKFGNQHFGPEPHDGIGPEAVHAQMHEIAVGKTIVAVWLGDDKPVVTSKTEPIGDGLFRSEYLVLEFSDGTELALGIGSGNSFCPYTGKHAKSVLQRAKAESKRRTR
jgi:hypothetical protein